jgi:serine phosphatase RsbU (regulator of sigma subunit)
MTFQQTWQKISNLGIQPTMTEIEQRSIILSNQIAALLIPVIAIITAIITTIAGAITPIAIFQPINIVLLFLVFYLNYKGNTLSSRILMCVSPSINLTIVSIYTKTVGISATLAFTLLPRTGLVIMTLLPVLFFGYANWRYMLLGMVVPFCCLAFFDFWHNLFGVDLLIIANIPQQDYFLIRVSYFIILLGAIPAILVIQRLNIQYEQEVYQQKEEILTQRDDLDKKSTELQKLLHEISLKNENITASINYAKRIQTAMMPTEDEIKLTFPQSFVFFKPRDIVSGDFYYFSDLGHTVIMAAVDCTGHGIPGAFMSMIGNEILNETILGKDYFDTDVILNELHFGVQKALKQKETQNQDGMDICLVSLKRNEGKRNEKFISLSYSGAMNSLYIVKKKELQASEFIEIKADKSPIGGLLSETKAYKFTKHTIDLTEKATSFTFFIASDGYQDQFGGEKGSKFMVKHFKTLLASIGGETTEQQKQILEKTLHDWQNPHNKYCEQVDDILVIGIKVENIS